METDNQIHCPKCNSTQITANQKGFSGGKALAGAMLTGGIGLLAGTIGSKNVVITCLSCGNTFKPGDTVKKYVTPSFGGSDFISPAKQAPSKYQNLALKILLGILVGGIGFILFILAIVKFENGHL